MIVRGTRSEHIT